MPVYKKKLINTTQQLELIDSEHQKDQQVWLIPYTGQIFLNYSEYLNNTALYNQPLWQCAVTGKLNLTYADALESEQKHREQLDEKFPEGLKKPILKIVQFSLERLDDLVTTIYESFKNRYTVGEIVNVVIDEKKSKAKIVDIITANSINESDSSNSKSYKDSSLSSIYHVQLLDKQQNKGGNKIKTIVGSKALSRENLAFTKTIIRKFIKGSTTRETYLHAPWVIKPKIAKKYNIPIKLPDDLQRAKDAALEKSRKRKGKSTSSSNPSKKAKPNSKSNNSHTSSKSTNKIVKYPIEDLAVPLDASLLPEKPNIQIDLRMSHESVGAFLSVWNFFNIFGKSIGISFFNLDDFELALLYDKVQPKCFLIVELHVALLNAIIKDRLQSKGKKTSRGPTLKSTGSSTGTGTDTDSVEMKDADDVRELSDTSIEILDKLGRNWDKRLIPLTQGRNKWENILVGFLYDMGTYEIFPDLDKIFLELVENVNGDIEENYMKLDIDSKLKILNFLVNIITKTSIVHEHIENSVEKLSDLNKEKNEISRERRQTSSSITQLEQGIMPAIIKTIQTLNTEKNAKGKNYDEALILKQLRDDEMSLQRRACIYYIYEEQIDKDKKKYAFPRTIPLGYDRFYNKYFYFDGIGMAVGEKYGTGRIWVQAPQEHDLKMLTANEQQHYYKRKKVEDPDMNFGQWSCYEDVNDIDQLMKWFNSNGNRESVLKNEFLDRYQELSTCLVKRQQDLAIAAHMTNEVRRSKRLQVANATAVLSSQSYMKWTNKLAK
nr:9011_t:CDS:10 [Entrophospora candida]